MRRVSWRCLTGRGEGRQYPGPYGSILPLLRDYDLGSSIPWKAAEGNCRFRRIQPSIPAKPGSQSAHPGPFLTSERRLFAQPIAFNCTKDKKSDYRGKVCERNNTLNCGCVLPNSSIRSSLPRRMLVYHGILTHRSDVLRYERPESTSLVLLAVIVWGSISPGQLLCCCPIDGPSKAAQPLTAVTCVWLCSRMSGAQPHNVHLTPGVLAGILGSIPVSVTRK